VSAVILLNTFSMPLEYTSFPSSMSMIHRFGLLMVSQKSCIFHLYFFSFFSLSSSACSNTSAFSQGSINWLQFDPVYWTDF
jgi:hypothetical protein